MKLLPLSFLALLTFTQILFAAGPARYEISISNHRIFPAQTIVPANTPIQLLIRNNDNTMEALNSSLFRSKIIVNGNSTSTVTIRPLNTGVYYISGELHAGTQGRIIVK